MASCHLPPRGFRGTWRDDALARAVYSEAAGIGRIVPAAVAVPADAGDVVTVVRWAAASSLSLVPRGSGSSMAGGAIGPGVIVDLSRMNSIGEIDAREKSVWCGPGALRGDVNRAAGSHGLRFPVNPSSGEFCTIGGMVSTNAAGSHTLGFGAMRDWVLALDCVFDDGSRAVVERGKPIAVGSPEISGESTAMGIPAIDRFEAVVQAALAKGREAHHRGVAKESSGYAIAEYARSGELIDLLVGSEGTLAIIVGVRLRLDDLPAATSAVLGAFDSLDKAVTAAIAARNSGAAACEMLDRTFLEVAGGRDSELHVPALASLPVGTEAVLIAEVEADSPEAALSRARGLSDDFRSAGATIASVALAPAEQEEIWELRHAASPILARLDPSLKSMQFVEDSAVPPENLGEYIRGVRAALDARGIRGVIFGHAGDSHVHVNPLIDVSRPDWRSKVEALLDDIVDLTARLGGTLAGEHGDGRLRTPLLPKVWSNETIELFAKVKEAFDPKGILNPGVKVPLQHQRAIGDVKYDPALAPLPDAARSALDRVADSRSYSGLRLDLL